MSTLSQERSAPGDTLAVLPRAAGLAHLQSALGSVQRLIDSVDSDSLVAQELWEIEMTICGAYKALVACGR